ncbi:MAG TPA: hypothetical protein DE045_02665 [Oceanospirillaceae bacterium]|nr:hypothetical protein [Oceanospirillaceae bacterium]
MWFEQIQRIAELARRRYRDGQVLVIAVDGCGGAGKTTLCQTLAQQVQLWAPAQVLKLDDFYQPLSQSQHVQLDGAAAQSAYFDLVIYRQTLLQPLLQGASVSYQPHHWLDGTDETSTVLQPNGVLIVDGVYAFSRAVRELVDISVFVDTPLKLRTQRLLGRPQPCTDWVPHWQRTEAWHHQHEDTLTAVDFVLTGTEQ